MESVLMPAGGPMNLHLMTANEMRHNEVVQKTIRFVDVVETLLLFQERYVITTVCSGVAQLILDNEMIQYELPCMVVPVSPLVVTRDLKNNSSVN
ncbi:hypothetical protein T03_9105 [Trichinella britovi]|uniref:Uncharacterized protein n=1 Tax=Trichinella britovi TaxID=45882 RepID=A0A0V1CJV4_TRIBR|nr:hypothetical protein T03_9105 [Trichinella britovi]